jgi:uncharacterized membrane protein
MKTGLKAGSGFFLGMIVGMVFDHPAPGMLFGLMVGATAERRRQIPAAGSR